MPSFSQLLWGSLAIDQKIDHSDFGFGDNLAIFAAIRRASSRERLICDP
jgi:hypothetical protein